MTRAQMLDTITNIQRDIAEAHQILCRVSRSAETIVRSMTPTHAPLPGQGSALCPHQRVESECVVCSPFPKSIQEAALQADEPSHGAVDVSIGGA